VLRAKVPRLHRDSRTSVGHADYERPPLAKVAPLDPTDRAAGVADLVSLDRDDDLEQQSRPSTNSGLALADGVVQNRRGLTVDRVRARAALAESASARPRCARHDPPRVPTAGGSFIGRARRRRFS
jgi:hypothetical protein